MTHPLDIKYIGEMLPNISADILDKQKVLQPGNCVCFGGAFKIPMIVKMEMPNPMPFSSNCDVSGCWKLQVNGNIPGVSGSNGNTQDPISTVDNTSQDIPNIEGLADTPMSTDPEIIVA